MTRHAVVVVVGALFGILGGYGGMVVMMVATFDAGADLGVTLASRLSQNDSREVSK